MAFRSMSSALTAGASSLRRLLSTTSSSSSIFSPASSAAPSSREQADPSVNLFVSGLSKRTTTEGLKKAFDEFGEVVHAKVVTDRVSGYSKGFGFVKYATLEDAEKGMKGMDGQFLDGWVIFAEYARPRAPPTFPGNLGPSNGGYGSANGNNTSYGFGGNANPGYGTGSGYENSGGRHTYGDTPGSSSRGANSSLPSGNDLGSYGSQTAPPAFGNNSSFGSSGSSYQNSYPGYGNTNSAYGDKSGSPHWNNSTFGGSDPASHQNNAPTNAGSPHSRDSSDSAYGNKYGFGGSDPVAHQNSSAADSYGTSSGYCDNSGSAYANNPNSSYGTAEGSGRGRTG